MLVDAAGLAGGSWHALCLPVPAPHVTPAVADPQSQALDTVQFCTKLSAHGEHAEYYLLESLPPVQYTKAICLCTRRVPSPPHHSSPLRALTRFPGIAHSDSSCCFPFSIFVRSPPGQVRKLCMHGKAPDLAVVPISMSPFPVSPSPAALSLRMHSWEPRAVATCRPETLCLARVPYMPTTVQAVHASCGLPCAVWSKGQEGVAMGATCKAAGRVAAVYALPPLLLPSSCCVLPPPCAAQPIQSAVTKVLNIGGCGRARHAGGRLRRFDADDNHIPLGHNLLCSTAEVHRNGLALRTCQACM